MKVILFNGSPKEKGCTYTALKTMADTLNENGIETEIFHAGKATKGCMGCGYCKKAGKCITDDCLNEALKLMESTDGVVFGSPVHYASMSGAMTSFLDRLFFAGGARLLEKKPCAVCASCRRGGASATLDQLFKYPEFMQMPIITGQYWPMVYGNNPDEVKKDLEGMQIMRTVARNMAWILKCIEAGKNAGINPPETEEKIKFSYIR